jgi:hypothetical protein
MDRHFAWKAELYPGGSKLVKVLADLPSGPSRADPLLKHDTLDLIAKTELAVGRPEPQLEDVNPLKNGKELWLLKTASDGIAYVVDFKQSVQGGIDIGLSGQRTLELSGSAHSQRNDRCRPEHNRAAHADESCPKICRADKRADHTNDRQ